MGSNSAAIWCTPAGEALHSAAQQAGQLAGQVRAETLAEQALARAQQGEGPRTFTRLYADWALQLARASDQVRQAGAGRSAIEGLTVSLKDLFDVQGEATCAGSKVLQGAAAAGRHATVVQRLLRAGAVLVGRTNMTEFAYSGLGLNPHCGTPANPWQRAQRRIPGGSSSGAAVSVSDGMCAAAIGSDTGGSVRIPAALCGLTGFKPTARRVPQAGMLPLSQALDSVGVIAHDVASCLLLDEVIAHSPLQTAPRDLARAHFVVPQTVVLDGLDDTVARAFAAALQTLSRHGAKISELPIAAFAQLADINASGGFTAAEAWAWHADLLQTRQAEYDPRVASRMRRGEGFTVKDFFQLQRRRLAWQRSVLESMAPFDAILMPTVPQIAPHIAELQASDEAYFAANAAMLRNPTFINFLDGCAISLPCQEGGPQASGSQGGQAPVGLSLAGGPMQDADIAQWALAVEAALHAR